MPRMAIRGELRLMIDSDNLKIRIEQLTRRIVAARLLMNF